MLTEPGFVDASELSTTWVDAHWDGPRVRARAVRVAALAAGLAALARTRSLAGRTALAGIGVTAVTGEGRVADARADAGRDGGDAATGEAGRAWRLGGRTRSTDRWPT
jgi:hypothetical protein